jgi:hypothetical protein
MPLAILLAKFAFALWATRDLSHFRRLLNSRLGLYLGAQTASPCRCCRFAPPAFPKMFERALAKTSIRSKTARFI